MQTLASEMARTTVVMCQSELSESVTPTWFQILNGTESNDDKGNYEWKYACGLYIEHSLPSWQINRKMTMGRLGKPRMSMLGNNRQSAIVGQRQQNVT